MKWTPQRTARFMELVLENGGNATAALRELGLSKTAFYKRRQEHPKFAELVDEARNQGIDALEDEARRRAFNGTEESIYFQGDVVGTVQKYSDYLMGLMLKAHRSNYKERHELTGPGGLPLQLPQAPVIHAYIPDNGRKRDEVLIAENIKKGRNGRNGRNSRF